MHFVIIETPRLILKGLYPQDMTYLFGRCSKAGIMKILGHRSEEDYEQEAHKQRNGYATYNRSFLLFLLEDKAAGRIIGRCGLHNWNETHRRAEIGYVMEDESYKRKGLMTEAVAAVMDYGFGPLKLHRIEALVGAGNVPSLRIMEQFRFVREGLLREHRYSNGQYEDSVLFSRLHAEYLQEQYANQT